MSNVCDSRGTVWHDSPAYACDGSTGCSSCTVLLPAAHRHAIKYTGKQTVSRILLKKKCTTDLILGSNYAADIQIIILLFFGQCLSLLFSLSPKPDASIFLPANPGAATPSFLAFFRKRPGCFRYRPTFPKAGNRPGTQI